MCPYRFFMVQRTQDGDATEGSGRTRIPDLMDCMVYRVETVPLPEPQEKTTDVGGAWKLVHYTDVPGAK
jgi:hypothetical protein